MLDSQLALEIAASLLLCLGAKPLVKVLLTLSLLTCAGVTQVVSTFSSGVVKLGVDVNVKRNGIITIKL